MNRISLLELSEILKTKYHVKKIRENKISIVFLVDDKILLEGLFSKEEKQRTEKRTKQIIDLYGKIPDDEEINLGIKLEIKLNLDKNKVIKNFEMSPICDYLFNDLIAIIGIKNEDLLNETSRYRRYMAAKKYIEEIDLQKIMICCNNFSRK